MADGTGKLIGIDLGTTFSAVATLDEHGQPVTLPNRDGEMLTPSAVLLPADGEAVVGQSALDVALEQPDRVATLIKRRMGYPSYGRAVAGREFRPETLSAVILRKLAQDAEARIGPVRKAVITVPAYFDDTRRKAVQDAGRIAGLEVLDILDEPTAAALAYSFQSASPSPAEPADPGRQRTVLVYDLGGGTFDVTLVRLSAKRFQTLAIEGDVRLGGKDWDDRIVDHVAGQFIKQVGSDPRTDPQSLAALQAAAERAKRTLSKLGQTTVTGTHGGQVLTVPLSRAEFENLTRDLLVRTRLTTQQLLRQAGVGWEQVDRVLLVGGSTHMPMTRQMLQDLSGKAPDKSLAVSEVVARGAALHAGIRAAHRRDSRLHLEAAAAECSRRGGRDQRQRPQPRHRGQAAGRPRQRRADPQEHAAADRGQPGLPHGRREPVEGARQGAARRGAAGRGLHRHRRVLDRGPAAEPAEGAPVQVRCGVGSNGLIDVMALDMTSGKMARATLHRSSGLSDEEIAREAEWVRSLRIQ